MCLAWFPPVHEEVHERDGEKPKVTFKLIEPGRWDLCYRLKEGVVDESLHDVEGTTVVVMAERELANASTVDIDWRDDAVEITTAGQDTNR